MRVCRLVRRLRGRRRLWAWGGCCWRGYLLDRATRGAPFFDCCPGVLAERSVRRPRRREFCPKAGLGHRALCRAVRVCFRPLRRSYKLRVLLWRCGFLTGQSRAIDLLILPDLLRSVERRVG